jgi:hypothetical protein
MKFPTIHMNGTSGKDLLEQNLAVQDALRQLLVAMANAGPNGRDYYVQLQQDGFNVAQDEHHARLAKVRELFTDYDQLVENISDQIDERERIKAGAIRQSL